MDADRPIKLAGRVMARPVGMTLNFRKSKSHLHNQIDSPAKKFCCASIPRSHTPKVGLFLEKSPTFLIEKTLTLRTQSLQLLFSYR